MNQSQNVELARKYLTAIERGATGGDLAAFFTHDVVQQEFPNRLTPNGATRNLTQILEGAERGQAILQSQRYEVIDAMASGDKVVLEVQWAGKMAIAVAGLRGRRDARTLRRLHRVQRRKDRAPAQLRLL
ncbi:MAG: nuclear transport factor 2 family protein [Gemmatimonadaceae bacterium]